MALKKFVIGVVAVVALSAGVTAMTATSATAATTRAQIVSVAQSELNNSSRNYGSGPHTSSGICNFYTGYFRTWKSSSGCPSSSGVQWRISDWCADFVKYVWKTAGVTYADIPETSGGVITGWASSLRDYGVKYGTWRTRSSGYTPQPGDAVVFDWNGDGVIDHVGIVTSANSSTVYTIEGNSGSPSRTRAQSYSRNSSSIVGYSAPVGVSGSNPPPSSPPPSSGKYWVDTFANAPGYSSPGGTRTGTLYAGTNYVFCKVWGPKVQVGSDYNHWWLKTDLDEGSPWQNQYVSAYYLSRWGNDEAKDNNGVVIPNCAGSSPPPSSGKYWVDTFANAPGYSSPGGTRTGTLYAGTNYVFCKVWGPKVQVGSDYNHWWLKTDLDEGSPWQNQYVSAYYLSRWGNDEAKDNNGVVIPNC